MNSDTGFYNTLQKNEYIKEESTLLFFIYCVSSFLIYTWQDKISEEGLHIRSHCNIAKTQPRSTVKSQESASASVKAQRFT